MKLKRILDIIIPRFTTEYVALYKDKNGELMPTYSANIVDPIKDGIPDGVVLFQSFNLFGVALFPKCVSHLYTWQEYMEINHV